MVRLLALANISWFLARVQMGTAPQLACINAKSAIFAILQYAGHFKSWSIQSRRSITRLLLSYGLSQLSLGVRKHNYRAAIDPFSLAIRIAVIEQDPCFRYSTLALGHFGLALVARELYHRPDYYFKSTTSALESLISETRVGESISDVLDLRYRYGDVPCSFGSS